MFPKKDTGTLYGFALNSSLTLHLTMSHQHGFQPKGTVLRGFSDFLGIKHQQGLVEGMVNLCLILSITRGNGCLFSLVCSRPWTWRLCATKPMTHSTSDLPEFRGNALTLSSHQPTLWTLHTQQQGSLDPRLFPLCPHTSLVLALGCMPCFRSPHPATTIHGMMSPQVKTPKDAKRSPYHITSESCSPFNKQEGP